MDAELAAQKPTPIYETLPAEQLLRAGNDYTGRVAGNFNTWRESAVFDNGDGTRTLIGVVHDIADAPAATTLPVEDSPLGGLGDSVDYQKIVELNTTRDMLRGPLGPVTSMLGASIMKVPEETDMYVTTTPGNEFSGTYSGVWNFVDILQAIRDSKVYVAEVQILDSPSASEQEQVLALKAGRFFMSSHPDIESHDVLVHGLSILLLTEGAVGNMATHISTLSDFRLREYLGNLDAALARPLQWDVETALADEENGYENLEDTLATIMYGGDPYLTDEQKETVRTEAREVTARARKLIALGQAQALSPPA